MERLETIYESERSDPGHLLWAALVGRGAKRWGLLDLSIYVI